MMAAAITLGIAIPAFVYALAPRWRRPVDRLPRVARAMIAFNFEALNALGTRLFDHADSITNVAAHEMEVAIRLAARATSNLAIPRFRVAEIAEAALIQVGAAIRRDLLDALAEAEC